MAAEGMAAGRVHVLNNRGPELAERLTGSRVQVAQHELLSCCTTLLSFRATNKDRITAMGAVPHSAFNV